MSLTCQIFPFQSLPFKYPAQRSSPVGSLVRVLDVHRTTDLTVKELKGVKECKQFPWLLHTSSKFFKFALLFADHLSIAPIGPSTPPRCERPPCSVAPSLYAKRHNLIG